MWDFVQAWEVVYFSSVIFFAAASGVFRAIYNGNYKSTANVVAVAGVSGLLGFAVVAILGGDHRAAGFNHIFYVGIAIFVGLAGREQVSLITAIWQAIAGKVNVVLGIEVEEES